MIPKIDDSILCPVLAYQLCVDGSKSIDIDLSKKYLFRTLDASKSMATEDPVSSTVEPNTSRNLVTLVRTNLGYTYVFMFQVHLG